MAQAPLTVRPQDIAMGPAAYALVARLLALLIEKGVISNAEAAKLVAQCAAAQDQGGDINKLAGQILKSSLRPSQPSAAKGDGAPPSDEPA